LRGPNFTLFSFFEIGSAGYSGGDGEWNWKTVNRNEEE